MAFDDVGGVGGEGRDGAEVFVDETVLGRDKVLVVDNCRMSELDNEIVEVVAGEFLGCNVSKDIEEGLVINEGGRRSGDKDRSRGGRGAVGVSGGWEVPGVVRTVEKVLDFLGGGSKVGCVDIVDR